MKTIHETEHWDTVAAGNVRLKVGDVMTLDSRRHICEFVNDSRARMIPMTFNTKTITPLVGESVTIKSRPVPVSIANSVSRELVLERLGESGLADLLNLKKQPRQEQEPNNETGGAETAENIMSKTKSKPRGGLAVLAAASKKQSKKDRANRPESGETPAPKKRANKPEEDIGMPKQTPAKTFIEELLNGGSTTKAEAVAQVVEKYGVTEKAAKGAVNNARHYQKKEGRPVGEWKEAEKLEPETAGKE